MTIELILPEEIAVDCIYAATERGTFLQWYLWAAVSAMLKRDEAILMACGSLEEAGPGEVSWLPEEGRE